MIRSVLRVMIEAPVFHTCRYLLNSAIDSLDGLTADDHHPSRRAPDTRAPAAADPDCAGPRTALSVEVSAQGRQLSWELDRYVGGGSRAVYRGRLLAYGDSHVTQLHSILTVHGAEQDAEEQDLARMHRQLTARIKAVIEAPTHGRSTTSAVAGLSALAREAVDERARCSTSASTRSDGTTPTVWTSMPGS